LKIFCSCEDDTIATDNCLFSRGSVVSGVPPAN
jgi:hypothetical protein